MMAHLSSTLLLDLGCNTTTPEFSVLDTHNEGRRGASLFWIAPRSQQRPDQSLLCLGRLVVRELPLRS